MRKTRVINVLHAGSDPALFTSKHLNKETMNVHELKTIQPFFDMVADGRKKFELRKNDREFNFGDLLILREWNERQEVYRGNEVVVRITGILKNFPGLEPGYCILSISDPI